MAVLSLPAWPFEPNWNDRVSETLSWRTDIMTSITGAEQRRAIRAHPRREYQFTSALIASERSLFDNLITAYGSAQWYLPLWHHVSVAEWRAPPGAQFISCADPAPEIEAGSVVFITGANPYLYQLVEVAYIGPAGINLVRPLARAVEQYSRIHPCTIARMTEQPFATKRSSNTYTVTVNFSEEVARPNPANTNRPSAPDMPIHRTLPTLLQAPDDNVSIKHGFERMVERVDNESSLPYQRDTAGRAFEVLEHTWVMHGRAEYSSFIAMLYALRGRALPIWVPTYMDDFVLAEDMPANSDNIVVQRSGFHLTGGPRPDREDILIDMVGRTERRRIMTSAGLPSTHERLTLGSPIASPISRSAVRRISFMSRMRLNHDAVEIVHLTDTSGTSTAKLTFRSASHSRVVS